MDRPVLKVNRPWSVILVAIILSIFLFSYIRGKAYTHGYFWPVSLLDAIVVLLAYKVGFRKRSTQWILTAFLLVEYFLDRYYPALSVAAFFMVFVSSLGLLRSFLPAARSKDADTPTAQVSVTPEDLEYGNYRIQIRRVFESGLTGKVLPERIDDWFRSQGYSPVMNQNGLYFKPAAFDVWRDIDPTMWKSMAKVEILPEGMQNKALVTFFIHGGNELLTAWDRKYWTKKVNHLVLLR